MSLWTDLRNVIRQIVLIQERVERLSIDGDKNEDRLFDHEQRLTRLETLVAAALHRQLPRD